VCGARVFRGARARVIAAYKARVTAAQPSPTNQLQHTLTLQTTNNNRAANHPSTTPFVMDTRRVRPAARLCCCSFVERAAAREVSNHRTCGLLSRLFLKVFSSFWTQPRSRLRRLCGRGAAANIKGRSGGRSGGGVVALVCVVCLHVVCFCPPPPPLPFLSPLPCVPFVCML
jgi:hypothetical protein